MRLESLGTDLVEISKLEESEFDFSVPVSVGGLARNELEEPSWGQLQQDIDNFSQLLNRRETELSILNSLLLEKNLIEESKPNGYPVDGAGLRLPMARESILQRRESMACGNRHNECK